MECGDLHENINHRLISLNTWPPVGGNGRSSTALGAGPGVSQGSLFLCILLADQELSAVLAIMDSNPLKGKPN